jgi:hypothetical protein
MESVMRMAMWGVVSVGVLLGVGCTASVTTQPYPVSATAAIEQNDLLLPPGLEVRSAGYSVTGLADVSGINGSTSSVVQVRPLLTVFAVRRKSGEQFVLIYDDLTQRRQPSQVIRLVASSDTSGR